MMSTRRTNSKTPNKNSEKSKPADHAYEQPEAPPVGVGENLIENEADAELEESKSNAVADETDPENEKEVEKLTDQLRSSSAIGDGEETPTPKTEPAPASQSTQPPVVRANSAPQGMNFVAAASGNAATIKQACCDCGPSRMCDTADCKCFKEAKSCVVGKCAPSVQKKKCYNHASAKIHPTTEVRPVRSPQKLGAAQPEQAKPPARSMEEIESLLVESEIMIIVGCGAQERKRTNNEMHAVITEAQLEVMNKTLSYMRSVLEKSSMSSVALTKAQATMATQRKKMSELESQLQLAQAKNSFSLSPYHKYSDSKPVKLVGSLTQEKPFPANKQCLVFSHLNCQAQTDVITVKDSINALLKKHKIIRDHEGYLQVQQVFKLNKAVGTLEWKAVFPSFEAVSTITNRITSLADESQQARKEISYRPFEDRANFSASSTSTSTSTSATPVRPRINNEQSRIRSKDDGAASSRTSREVVNIADDEDMHIPATPSSSPKKRKNEPSEREDEHDRAVDAETEKEREPKRHMKSPATPKLNPEPSHSSSHFNPNQAYPVPNMYQMNPMPNPYGPPPPHFPSPYNYYPPPYPYGPPSFPMGYPYGPGNAPYPPPPSPNAKN